MLGRIGSALGTAASTTGLFGKTMWRGLQVGTRDAWRGSPTLRRMGYGAAMGAAFGLGSEKIGMGDAAWGAALFAGPYYGIGRGAVRGFRASLRASGGLFGAGGARGAFKSWRGAGTASWNLMKAAGSGYMGMGHATIDMGMGAWRTGKQFGSTMSRAYNGFRAL